MVFEFFFFSIQNVFLTQLLYILLFIFIAQSSNVYKENKKQYDFFYFHQQLLSFGLVIFGENFAEIFMERQTL